jgi:hypothetical protein
MRSIQSCIASTERGYTLHFSRMLILAPAWGCVKADTKRFVERRFRIFYEPNQVCLIFGRAQCDLPHMGVRPYMR